MTTCSRRSPTRRNAGKQLWLEAWRADAVRQWHRRASRSTAQALKLKVVDVADGDWQAADVIVHDRTNKAVAHMLVDMPFGAFPMALGVIYDDPRPTFESAVVEQNAEAAKGKTPDLQALVSKGQTWQVEKEPHEL